MQIFIASGVRVEKEQEAWLMPCLLLFIVRGELLRLTRLAVLNVD